MTGDLTILVCGGRTYGYDPATGEPKENEIKRLHKVLQYSLEWGLTLVPKWAITYINGGANGADKLSGDWASSNNLMVRYFPADWAKYGKSAGYIRNKKMLDEGRPNIVIAFPGGRGTANMVTLAKQAGIPVLDLNEEIDGQVKGSYVSEGISFDQVKRIGF